RKCRFSFRRPPGGRIIAAAFRRWSLMNRKHAQFGPLLGLLAALAAGVATAGRVRGPQPASHEVGPVCTFSIVAHDPDKQEWGIGVASKFLAVGTVVPWA